MSGPGGGGNGPDRGPARGPGGTPGRGPAGALAKGACTICCWLRPAAFVYCGSVACETVGSAVSGIALGGGAMSFAAAFPSLSGTRSARGPVFIASSIAFTPSLSPFLVSFSSFRSRTALKTIEILLLNGPFKSRHFPPSGGHLLMTGFPEAFRWSSSSTSSRTAS